MKHTRHECTQCGTEYSYYMSGNMGIDWNLNDEKLCPDCMKIVRKALLKVKKKFEWRDLDASDEITLDELLAEEKKPTEAKGIFGRRVYAGLFDITNGDRSHSRDISVGKKEYNLTTWDHNPEYMITKSIRWDIINNKAVDGKEYHKPKKLIDESKQKVYQQWLDSRPKNHDYCPVIPLSEPVGLKMALGYLYEGKAAADVTQTGKEILADLLENQIKLNTDAGFDVSDLERQRGMRYDD